MSLPSGACNTAAAIQVFELGKTLIELTVNAKGDSIDSKPVSVWYAPLENL